MAIPPQALGLPLDVEVLGHLRPAISGATRAARWEITITSPPESKHLLQGSFLESWSTSRQDRREHSGLRISRTAELTTLPALSIAGATIARFRVRGQAENKLTIGLRRRTQPPIWLLVTVAAFLFLGASRFDRASGAGRTSASLTIATGAVVVGSVSFPAIGSVDPTFRELLGAIIIGALVGGPLGGVMAWLLDARRATHGETQNT